MKVKDKLLIFNCLKCIMKIMKIMIKSYNDKGYILKVDVKYPKQLHDDI